MIDIQNAIIKSTRLGPEDHGIFTAVLQLEIGDHTGGSFGGFTMDEYVKDEAYRSGVGFGIDFIAEVLKIAGVRKWEDLPGKHIRVECPGPLQGPTKIGHILKDEWFDPKELAKRCGYGGDSK